MHKKNKIKILAGLSILLGFIVFSFSNFNLVKVANETYSLDINEDYVITMDSKKQAYTDLIINPYEKVDVFISDEKTSQKPFTLVAGSWEEFSPNGTLVEVEIRFKEDGVWTQWIGIDEDLDSEDGETKNKYGMASSNSAESFQYKYIMYSEGDKTPVISNIKWTLIKTGETLTVEKTPVPMFASSSLSSNVTYLALSSYSSNIISRKSWGADEKYRYLEFNNPYADEQVVVDAIRGNEKEDTKKTIANKYYKEIMFDENGDEYTWNIQYPKKVDKIIIHHTATTSNLTNPKQAIRDIYYYHAVSKGWGDIGYNYIIDKDGNIYEGRYGGEGVVGGHSYGYNSGSIGIAVLGNYDQTEVPTKVISTLKTFIAEKAKIHNIVVSGKSYYNGEYLYNILGHRDVAATACPGQNLYDLIPVLRNTVSKTTTQSSKTKFVNDYDYLDKSKLTILEIESDKSLKISIKLQNTGKKTWNSETFLTVNQNPDFNGVISFPAKKGEVLAKIKERSVKSGAYGNFTFVIKPESIPKLVYLELAPVINGDHKVSNYIVLPVNVHKSYYDYELKNVKSPTSALKSGKTMEVYINLKNTGTKTWDKDKTMLIGDLGTKLTLSTKDTNPGSTGKFVATYKAPQSQGYSKENFNIKFDEDILIENTGIYFETTVLGDGTKVAELLSVTERDYLDKGKKYIYYIKLRNLSSNTWYSKDLTLDSEKNSKIFVSDILLDKTKVAPGELGTITFKLSIPDTIDSQTEILNVIPKFKGNSILENKITFPLNFNKANKNIYVPVVPTPVLNTNTQSTTPVQTNSDNIIRVKISYSGNPEISSSNGMTVYSADEKLLSLKAGEKIKVENAVTKYLLTQSNGSKIYRKDEIRFIPNENSILKIENFEHRPTWNASLNDNEYRGILEVNRDASSLIVVNELDIESYLKGLAEIGNADPENKIKTIIVAARTYAKYYTTLDKKFPGKPYDLDDNPDNSQAYLGYGFEKRAEKVTKAVEDTKGEVMKYNGTLIKTPYFSKSDGTMTKSPKDVWGWDAPYLAPVNDKFCTGSTSFSGHGVGLSGCGATGMANAGYSYKTILEYYYTKAVVSKIY